MRTFTQVSTIRTFVRAAKEDGKVIGFVPTMGALHEGHVSLMRKARSECDVVIVSVFVNPAQFGPNEDFHRYPRSIERDSALTQGAGADAMFIPSVEEIYPPGCRTIVEVPGLGDILEGAARPGHFRGVATVCAVLFNVTQPTRAYFGRKDYQQLKIIERMVADLHIPVTIVPVPTVREPDGLALSSRNQYLSANERHAATFLSRALNTAKKMYDGGERSTETLQNTIQSALSAEPVVETQYVVVVDAETLEPIHTLHAPGAALIAAKIGSTRLIDNVLLENHLRPSGPGET
jgi:pantoate--beta-alanine ligase